MIYVGELTAEEQRELRRVMRREVGRVSQRAHMILLSAQRKTVPEIAAIFDTTPVTVRFWLRRFEAQGMAGLYDQPRPGPQAKAGAVESPI